jgi:DNA mismatch endonuclease (patch repair protein)
MASIRSSHTRPERALRSALRQAGESGYRVHWRGPGGRIDIAFVGRKVAVFVDGSFWHGHPSKWQPGRWNGYWDEKIKRNLARDADQNQALAEAGWIVLRFWDFEVDRDASDVARKVCEVLDKPVRRRTQPT